MNTLRNGAYALGVVIPIRRAANMVSERLSEWETWQQAQSLSTRTTDERMRILRRFAEWTKVDPADANYPQIVSWLAHDGGSPTAWSPATRAVYKSALSSWFGWLVRMDYRTDNPMAKIGTAKVPRREARPVADENMPRLMATPMHHKTRIMILLAAYAGLRAHEIAKVRGEDVDVAGMTITVRGKGGVVATLPIPAALAQAATSMPGRGWWFRSRAPEGHVQAKSVSAVVSSVMRRAGVPGTCHSLRHWYATTMVDEDVDLRTVQELLRHASLATTQIYTHVSPRRRRDAVEHLDIMRSLHTA